MESGALWLGLGGCTWALVRCSGIRKNAIGCREQSVLKEGGEMDSENNDLHIPCVVVGTELLEALLEGGNGALWVEMEFMAPFLQLMFVHVHAKKGG